MNSHPHTVTVGETFNDVAVSITLEFTDAANGIGPRTVLGEQLVSVVDPAGKAVRDTLREYVGIVATRIGDSVWNAHLKEDDLADARREKELADAVQAAKDETAKLFGDLHENYKQGVDKAEIAREQEFAKAEQALVDEIKTLKAQLAAKAKCSAAARRTPRKAGRK